MINLHFDFKMKKNVMLENIRMEQILEQNL